MKILIKLIIYIFSGDIQKLRNETVVSFNTSSIKGYTLKKAILHVFIKENINLYSKEKGKQTSSLPEIEASPTHRNITIQIFKVVKDTSKSKVSMRMSVSFLKKF